MIMMNTILNNFISFIIIWFLFGIINIPIAYLYHKICKNKLALQDIKYSIIPLFVTGCAGFILIIIDFLILILNKLLKQSIYELIDIIGAKPLNTYKYIDKKSLKNIDLYNMIIVKDNNHLIIKSKYDKNHINYYELIYKKIKLKK